MITDKQKNRIVAAQLALESSPADFDTHMALGIAQFEADQFAEAMATFAQANRVEPSAATAFNWMGRVHYHLGPPQASIDAYEQAITLEPKYVEPYFGLGILQFSQIGDYDAALKAFQRGLQQSPANSYLVAFIGNSYARMGRFTEAIRSFEQAIAMEPDNGFAYSNLSIVYLYLKQYDDLIAACQREIAIGDDAEPRRLLGYAYHQLGKLDEAAIQLERSVALKPEDYEARGALATVYRKLGRRQEADEQYAIAHEAAKNDDEYGQACFAAVTGDLEQTLALLMVALDKEQVQPGWLRIDPEFTFYNDEPRFKALLAR